MVSTVYEYDTRTYAFTGPPQSECARPDSPTTIHYDPCMLHISFFSKVVIQLFHLSISQSCACIIYTKTFPGHTLTTLSYSIMSRNKVDSYSYLDMMRDSGLHKSMMEESIRFDHALNIQVHSSIEKFVNTLLSKNVFVSRALRAWEILAYGASTAMVLYGVSLVIEALGRPPPPPSHRGPETST